MIEQSVVVVAVLENRIIVKAPAMSDCARCAEGKGCGGSIFTRLFGSRDVSVSVISDLNLKSHDMCTLAIDESLLVRASLRLYGLPLAIFLIVSLLCFAVGLGDGVNALLSLLALIGAYLWIRQHPADYQKNIKLLPLSANADCDLAKAL